jgi:hypothetical protein
LKNANEQLQDEEDELGRDETNQYIAQDLVPEEEIEEGN